mgnify:FL=1
MRFPLILILALFCVQSFAGVVSVKIDASATNVPTTYSTASTSRVLVTTQRGVGLLVDNRSASPIAVNCAHFNTSTAPSSDITTVRTNLFVPGNASLGVDNVGFSTQCFLRSDSGSAITSGIIVIHFFTPG